MQLYNFLPLLCLSNSLLVKRFLHRMLAFTRLRARTVTTILALIIVMNVCVQYLIHIAPSFRHMKIRVLPEAAERRISSGDVGLPHLYSYSRCADGIFRVFVYPLLGDLADNSSSTKSQTLARALHRSFTASNYATEDPSAACLFVYVVAADQREEEEEEGDGGWRRVKSMRERLVHYRSNEPFSHLIVFTDSTRRVRRTSEDSWKVIFAASNFRMTDFIPNVDIMLNLDVTAYNAWNDYPPVSLENKDTLLTLSADRERRSAAEPDADSSFLAEDLLRQATECDGEAKKCAIHYRCADAAADSSAFTSDDEWFPLCGDRRMQEHLISSSLFTLIPPRSPASNLIRLHDALRFGSIPVVVGTDHRWSAALPLHDFIDWRKAVVEVPSAHHLRRLFATLRLFSAEQMMEMLRNGRFIYQHYLGNTRVLVRSILSAIRMRLRLDAPPERSAPVRLLLTIQSQRPLEPLNITIRKEHYVEPVYELWNKNPTFLDATPLAPMTRRVFIPDGTERHSGMAAVNQKRLSHFTNKLAGSYPPEMFTVVVLNYDRDAQLMETLRKLNGLPFLHRVIVVWNDIKRQPPTLVRNVSGKASLAWPQLHVPIFVVSAERNSLNNRFLPLKLIETEAVFSIDDDFSIHQEKILFTFRTWREARDRLVGPIARLASMTSDSSRYLIDECQYNMALTGGVFLHRAFLTAYSSEMPASIREHIDQLRNCEDIAMNFFVSHLTRKAPLKTSAILDVRGKMSARGTSLSKRPDHYKRRADCIAVMLKTFGYNPLVLTEYRADSVLYKTNKLEENKCYLNT